MDEILVDRDERGVVTLTLNRPQVKNAIVGDMWEELQRIFQEVTRRESDRVLVVTGAGGAFCAGAELSDDMATGTHPLNAMHPVNAAALALHEVSKPTIAKVRGVAVGAGMNLALGCDLIVAGESARFSQIFARRALSVDFGGTWLLPRLVGLHKAKELALFGDIISAEDARQIGIVNRVLPDDELDAFVSGWAERLAAGPPLALQMTKRMLANSLSQSLSEALSWEAAAQTVNFGSEDTREGVLAFIEKRTPVYHGR
ncbi:MAG: enoyl-CoA hydratase/isomerase family protein [Deltaproteobacteria bacterium]|nr:enoyl-CoA hydratase/isomerase family protein [Deltaproteobacteria bacterium]MBW2386059.1 enoyl-CoA hydratase/isomerase family protein [Deltaproteobacteria bacterium]MBW2695891.1 enoyl-CoA hydratase/isomerase family protein [Deltaproteobacteria bacterium]